MQHPVQQRGILRAQQAGIGVRVDAVDKQVRVEAGRAGGNQHRAVAVVQRNNRAAPPVQRLHGKQLQGSVNGKVQVLAGFGRFPENITDGPALGIDLHLLITGITVQQVFIGFLHPRLADVVGAAIA